MTKIAYLGPEGTFTEEALNRYMEKGGRVEKVPLPTVSDVIKYVDMGQAQEGLVPIENSIEGSVNITLDVLTFESESKVVREITIPVRHSLIAKKGYKPEGIKKIISHPHATAQCRNYLRTYFPQAEIIAANSTAEAVKKLIETNSDTAAIGTEISAGLYDLEIVARDIEDNKENRTRFVFVGNAVPPKTGDDKTSLVCFLKKDKPGSLYNILEEFAERSINLNRLESRPAKKNLGDYVFMIDVEGHIHDKQIFDAIESLRKKVYLIKILGSYPAWKEAKE
ncbi:MAG: prephenate dehydratase [Actinomycetota bacterium]|nr:prephenate dehydratase [Actinomycetota bacterium]